MGRNRGKKGSVEAKNALPWQIWLVFGIVAFLAVRYGFVWWMSHQGGLLAQGFKQQSGSTLAPLAWLVLAACWIGAAGSYIGARKRRALVDTSNSLASLAAISWREFEMLVGEAFRRQGYAIEETGLGGADGGIDLILRRDGKRTLVQCKQWKRQQVGVSIVREMAGLLAHHNADAVKIVCIGSYTNDAKAFARGKPIELISGEQLLGMIRAVQRARDASPPVSLQQRTEPSFHPVPEPVVAAPVCPRCGAAMVERRNRKTGQMFLGCSRFPGCRGSG